MFVNLSSKNRITLEILRSNRNLFIKFKNKNKKNYATNIS